MPVKKAKKAAKLSPKQKLKAQQKAVTLLEKALAKNEKVGDRLQAKLEKAHAKLVKVTNKTESAQPSIQ